jgi:SAM-dependent methyltransferase
VHDDASISFDRAANYYDLTRRSGVNAMDATVRLLAAELAPRGRVLEIGVGTGQVALPLRAAGVNVVGCDLSPAMMEVLRTKPGGGQVPLVLADATKLPVEDGVFGASYFRWVLHLIPDWRRAMQELVRATRPGGVVLGLLGDDAGRRSEIKTRCCQIAGVSGEAPGLAWGDTESLDEQMSSLGCRLRLIGPFKEDRVEKLSKYLDDVAEGRFSWTWPIPEDKRRLAVEQVRPWVLERWGPSDLDQSVTFSYYWRSYQLPDGPA